ncbi:MAG TPA: ATP-binding cassette domain-containing protein [Candidatus Cybelea sp.]|nr:ATP-binding cassette domain-containing protein [Candidatus Cybelea sp.]
MKWTAIRPGRRQMEVEGPAAVQLDPVRESVAITLDDVTRSFGRRDVLRALSLHIAPNEFVAVVGRSGCGKTTLLRTIAGLESVDHGQVAIDGVPVVGLRRDLQLLCPEPRLLPWHRIIANVGIARGQGWRGRALAALTEVELRERADDWPSALSVGQKQRVALARALVSRPRVLLMDEPFDALGVPARSELQQLLIRLRGDYRFTAVLATRDVREALTLADRVLIMRDGAVAKEFTIQTPLQLRRASPALAHLEQSILAAV